MLDDVHRQREQTLSKIRVELELVLDRSEGAGAEAFVNNWQLSVQLFSHFFDHRREKVENFGVSGVLGIRFVVVD